MKIFHFLFVCVFRSLHKRQEEGSDALKLELQMVFAALGIEPRASNWATFAAPASFYNQKFAEGLGKES